MGNFLKIKKGKIILLLLFLNQFLFSVHAVNSKKIDLGESNKNNFYKKNNKPFKILITEKNKNEKEILLQDTNKLEKFLEETFDPNELQ